MFGIYRLILATFVSATHMGKLPAAAGGYAVFGFYLLSGYLMTLVLNEVYLKRQGGILIFYFNRVLRIFPPFLFITLVSIVTLLMLSDVRHPVFNVMHLPSTTTGFVISLTLIDYIGLNGNLNTHVFNMQVIPVAWSISVEWIFYLLMPFLVRNKTSVVIWLAISVGYTILAITQDYPYEMRYNSPLAASLPFSIGSLIYHFARINFPRVSWKVILGVAALLIFHSTRRHVYNDPMMAGLYVAIVANALLLILLSAFTPSSAKVGNIDKMCGRLSYPVFLCHYWVGLVVVTVFPTLRP